MRTSHLLLSASSLLACHTPEPADTWWTPEVETEQTEACVLLSASQLDERTDVYHELEAVEYVAEDPSLFTIVSDIPGHQEVQDIDWEWVNLLWVVDETLAPSTEYTIEVNSDVCHLDETFTTSEYGAPVADIGRLAGRSWRLRLPRYVPIEPHDMLDLFEDRLESTTLLLSVLSASAEGLEVVLGAVEGAEQDYCRPTTASGAGALLDDHAFTAALVGDVWLTTDGGERVILTDPVVELDIHPEGDTVVVTLTATLDTRWIVTYGDSDESFCDELEAWGRDPCGACPDDGLPYCVSLQMFQEWEGVPDTIVEVPCAEAPGCADGPPEECTG